MTARSVAGPVAFITAFFGLSLFTIHPEWVASPVDFSRVVWFPSALAVGVVLRYGIPYIGWTFVAEFLVTMVSRDPIGFALTAALGNALEAGVALAVFRKLGFRPTLERGRDVVVLIVGGALTAAFVGALVSVSGWMLFRELSVPPGRLLALWWLTHANGILLGVPVLLAWWHGDFDRIRSRATEAALLAVAILLLGSLMLDDTRGALSARSLLYVPFPVLIWSAFRFRLVGAAVANVLLALPVMAITALGTGPFNVVPVERPGPDALFELWIFLAVNAVTALFVAAVVEEREREVTARLAAEEERRRMSERVARARRAESLGVLAGGIAHDFNNLLVSVMGHSELAARRLDRHHPAHESVEEIMRASQRAAEICRQMLAYAGRGRVSNATVDLAEVASEMTELVAVSFPETTRVEVDLQGSGGLVWGDVTQLRRVTLNLLTNAADAMPSHGGTVRISTGPIARHQLREEDLVAGTLPEGKPLVHLTVEDDGRGLEPELRERIFEPFFSTKSRGRGLGLAAVLGIVVAHEGVLELDASEGEGARFRIVLPVTDREPEPTLATVGAPDAVAGSAVLVADDEAGVLDVAVQMLLEAGATVEAVGDGREAIERFSASPHHFDAVLLDISMPGKTGIEALEVLRETRPDIPAVLMTGNIADAERVEETHGVPVLTKPFRIAEVVDALERARLHLVARV